MDYYNEIEGALERIETALNSALNMVEGDGMPPDWDYLRLVRSQLPALREAIFNHANLSAAVAVESGPR